VKPDFLHDCKVRRMSVIKPHGTKIILPRTGPDEFWQIVHRHCADEDPVFWKYLAMLALRENAGWPVHCIGSVFGHNKGHVTRCLRQIKRELRVRFQASPEYLDLPEDEEVDQLMG
jgi:hypothetical protein